MNDLEEWMKDQYNLLTSRHDASNLKYKISQDLNGEVSWNFLTRETHTIYAKLRVEPYRIFSHPRWPTTLEQQSQRQEYKDNIQHHNYSVGVIWCRSVNT